MFPSRRKFLRQSTAIALAAGTGWRASPAAPAGADGRPPRIIDTHQHLWDLDRLAPPWLARAPEILRHTYHTREYLEATRGWHVKAIYMEIDVAPEQHLAEVEHVVGLCRSDDHPTVAAVVGGRPASPGFAEYVTRLTRYPEVKGVRQVLHGAGTPAGYCCQPDFVRGIRLLGDKGLRFDLCQRPAELADGLELVRRCPGTQFIVDHCGNADPRAFLPATGTQPPSHDTEKWRSDMEFLAGQPHVACKISGIVARAPQGWRPEQLAPIVNHCLDVFGPDRVVFGGDWPVCLRGAPLADWIEALTQIVSERPAEEQQKLWHKNAARIYGLA